MIRRLKWILIAAEAWGWRRKGRWALAMLLVLAAGLSRFSNPVAFGGPAAGCPAAASAATGTLFSRSYGGSGNEDRFLRAVVPAPDGGFWLVSWTSIRAQYNPREIYVLRIDASGNVLWSRTYGGSQGEWVGSVLVTPDGGLLLGGSTKSFGAGGTRDIYLLRLNAAGDVVWSRTYGGSDTDESAIAIPTSDGGLLLAGWIRSTSPEFADSDTLLVKLDAFGNIQWGRRYDLYQCNPYGYASCEGSDSVVQTSDGNFVIGQNYFYTDYRTGATNSYGLLLKVDSSGDVLNFWKLTDEVAKFWLNDLSVTADGGVLIWGSTATGGLLARLDASGTATWKRGYSFPQDSGASVIGKTPDGGFLLLGSTFLTGPQSGYAVKISGTGDVQWARAYPVDLPGHSYATWFGRLALTSDNGFLMGGNVWPDAATGSDYYALYAVRTDAAGNSCNSRTVAAPTPHEPSFTISALSVLTTSSVSLTVGTPNTQSADVATQSAGLCRYLLYLPMVVKTP
jgi:hypothetical protein